MDSDSSSHNLNIIFVCYGNFCRSPMAEFIFKNLVKKSELNHLFKISSAAVTDGCLGKDTHIEARKELSKHNIPYQERKAVRLTLEDCNNADYIVCMTTDISKVTFETAQEENKHKICRLLDFSSNPIDIDDPMLTNDFERAYKEVFIGCKSFFDYLISKNHISICAMKQNCYDYTTV